MSKIKTLKKDTYGRLKILSYEHRERRTYAKCRCSCGKEKLVRTEALKSGVTKSCGCLHRERITTHGKTGSPVYHCWQSMKQRCYDSKSRNYKHYGGRGIKVCSRWMKFENFHKDMGDPPKGLSLDRIDNNGIYKPSNCRWANAIQQANSKRSTVLIDGLSILQYCIKHSINPGVIYDRRRYGWSMDEAINTPRRKYPVKTLR